MGKVIGTNGKPFRNLRTNKGLDFEEALYEKSKCGFDVYDRVTGKCSRVTLENGVLVVDSDRSTVETYCTLVYTIPNPASPASETFTFSGNPTNGNYIGLGPSGEFFPYGVFEFYDNGIGANPNRILIGANAEETIDNLVAAINGTGVPGTQYSNTFGDGVGNNLYNLGDVFTITKDSASSFTLTRTDVFGAQADAIDVNAVGGNISAGDGDADGTLVLSAATVELAVGGVALSNDPYEVLVAGTSNKATSLLAADVKEAFQANGVAVTAAAAGVQGTNYVLTLTINKDIESAVTAIDLTRDAVAIVPVSTC